MIFGVGSFMGGTPCPRRSNANYKARDNSAGALFLGFFRRGVLPYPLGHPLHKFQRTGRRIVLYGGQWIIQLPGGGYVTSIQ